jgi:hypothetical protein
MSHPPASAKHHVLPAQVWARLAADFQARAIRLMAQLAFKLVAAQSDSPIQESSHAVPPHHA